MHHHREGSGEPLVLIHGIGHHWQGWQPVIGPLAAHYDVIACDSPGFGQSAPLAAGVRPNVASYVDAFERFFAEAGLGRPHVAGNSMGGGIAIELLRRGSVRSATAFSPIGFWTPAERRWTQRVIGLVHALPAPAAQVLLAAQHRRAGRVATLSVFHGYPARVPPAASIAAVRALRSGPALRGALAAFDDYECLTGEQLSRQPLTIAWGNRDLLLPYGRQFPRAAQRIPSARHLTLGAGHLPCWDDPAAVVAAIIVRPPLG